MIQNMILSGGGGSDVTVAHPSSAQVQGTYVVLRGVPKRPRAVIYVNRSASTTDFGVYIEDAQGIALCQDYAYRTGTTTWWISSYTNNAVTMGVLNTNASFSTSAEDYVVIMEE